MTDYNITLSQAQKAHRVAARRVKLAAKRLKLLRETRALYQKEDEILRDIQDELVPRRRD